MNDLGLAGCQQPLFVSDKFGVVDPGGNNPAMVDFGTESGWHATIINEKKYATIFAPIDNCLPVQEHEGNLKRCDAALWHSANQFFILIELSKKKSRSIPKAKEQFKDTINALQGWIDQNNFRKKVFLISHPSKKYKVIFHEELVNFRNETNGFFLHIGNEYKLK